MKVIFRKRIATTNVYGNAYLSRKAEIPDRIPICVGMTFFDDDVELTVTEMAYDMKKGTLELWTGAVKTDRPLEEMVKEYLDMGWRATA